METRSRKAARALSPTDFRLIDFRVKKLTAERFIDAVTHEGDGGATRTWTSAESIMPTKSSPGETAEIDLTVKLEGFQGDGREDEDRSFSVTMIGEFVFVSAKSGWVRDEDCAEVVHFFALQAFPITVARLRQIAHEMGFTGVDPDIGLPPTSHPTVEDAKVVSSPRKRRAVAK